MRLFRFKLPLLIVVAAALASLLGVHVFSHAVSLAAVGTGAVYLKNLPAPNTYVIDPVTFAKETSRNRKQYVAQAIAALGGQANQKIDATGVVGRIRLIVKCVMTNNGVAAPTPTSQWPWNILKQITISANGINNLFSCDGLDLRALQRARNPYFIDREAAFAITAGAAGVSNITLIYEIPLAFDDESLMGAVFAQTQDTSLTWTVTLANNVDLFSAQNPASFTATVQAVVDFYSIPYIDNNGQRVAVIPDLRRMHGYYAQTNLLQALAYSPLMRVNGVLCRVFQRGDNAAGAAGDVDWSSLCTNHQFNYGSNVTPYDVPGIAQRMDNETDYGDQLIPTTDAIAGSVKYVCDDLVRDNALRDVIHLMGVTQPQMINTFNGLVVTNGNNSVVHTAQEHMIAGS
jgi:hypothetical protein